MSRAFMHGSSMTFYFIIAADEAGTPHSLGPACHSLEMARRQLAMLRCTYPDAEIVRKTVCWESLRGVTP
jgi:hypothetical protein